MPSEKVLASKKEVVANLAEKLKNATSVILVDYKGIPVAEDTALRKDYREAGVEYAVVKNNLLRFALEEVGLNDLTQYLSGTTAIAFTEGDAIAPAKIYAKYGKDKPYLNAKGGYVDGSYVDAAAVEEIANIPSKEILIATMLGNFNAPISGLARVLNAIAEKQSA